MSQQIINLLIQGFLETVQMTVISTVVISCKMKALTKC